MGVCSEISVGARKQSAEVNHFLLSLSAKCNSLISITQGCCPRCSAGALFSNLKGCLFFWRALKLGKWQRVGDVSAGPAGLGAGGSRRWAPWNPPAHGVLAPAPLLPPGVLSHEKPADKERLSHRRARLCQKTFQSFYGEIQYRYTEINYLKSSKEVQQIFPALNRFISICTYLCYLNSIACS